MLIRDHEVFVTPKLRKTVWRYMDFTKFVSLLEEGTLTFPRTDLFEDPYEGFLPEAAVREMRANLSPLNITPEQVELWIKFPVFMRKQLYVSCWFCSEHESAAMWKLYLSGIEGIAIRSNTDALAKALDSSPLTIGMGPVQYIDYETTSIPLGNSLFPVMHKRLSFAHEQEVRAVIWSELTENRPLIPEDSKVIPVSLDPSSLIDAIHVSPTAPLWFGLLVEKVVRRYGLDVPIIRSNLYNRPAY